MIEIKGVKKHGLKTLEGGHGEKLMTSQRP